MNWARILAYVTGMVDQELLARTEYLAAENQILKAQLKGRLKLSDAERAMLAEIGHRLGRKALAEVATVARPDTILAWYRKLVARKFDGSKAHQRPGRPRVSREVEELIVRMASENRDWGYDRIAGAMANLGYVISDQTVGNVLRRNGLPPAPERKRTTPWSVFIRTHLALLAGTDFFTAVVLTLRGLMTYYVLFFIHLESRKVEIAGITIHPNEQWMQQMARNVTMEGCGTLRDCRYLLHDRDTKYTISFRAIIESGRVKTLPLPARSPNLNAYAERWVRSVKEECLSKIIVFGERSLRRALSEYVAHYQAERNHQGKSNVLLFRQVTQTRHEEPVQCRERLGGLLNYYHQEAAVPLIPYLIFHAVQVYQPAFVAALLFGVSAFVFISLLLIAADTCETGPRYSAGKAPVGLIRAILQSASPRLYCADEDKGVSFRFWHVSDLV